MRRSFCFSHRTMVSLYDLPADCIRNIVAHSDETVRYMCLNIRFFTTYILCTPKVKRKNIKEKMLESATPAVLRWLHKNDGCLSDSTCDILARYSSAETMTVARELGYYMSKKVPKVAAQYGNLECLRYAMEECNISMWESNACYDPTFCELAARGGHINILQFAFSYKKPIQFEGYGSVYDRGFTCDENVCAAAAAGGHLECLKFLHDHGVPWDIITCVDAAKGGHLKCLKYAHENGCKKVTQRGDFICQSPECVCAFASQYGQLECLKYAHSVGFLWKSSTIYLSRDIECIKYAHENGCPWDAFSTKCAAGRGNLDILKYLHENGCPWDEWTCTNAAKEGKVQCLIYAHENGCPWSADTYYFACSAHQDACCEYLRAHGCPTDHP